MEECEHAIECDPGGMAFSVNQMKCEHAMGVMGDAVGVTARRVDLDGLEQAIELGTQVVKALLGARRVFGEAEAQDRDAATLGDGQVKVGDV